MKETTILLSAVAITGLLGLLVYSHDANVSFIQSADPTALAETRSEQAEIPELTQKTDNADELRLSIPDKLLCVDSSRGCFCRDAQGNKLGTSREQCLESVGSVAGQSYGPDAATLARLQRQKQLVLEIEASRQIQRANSRQIASIYVARPIQCPSGTFAIRQQSPSVTECVMQ